jgi:type IV secretory pathway VirB10-like protein
MASDANVLTAPGRDIERRTMPTLRFSFALILLLVFAASAGAQSLADVARREDARRKQVRKPSRVLTNKDLKPSETPSLPPPPAEAKAAAKTEAAAPAEPEVTDEEKRQKDEQAWRQRMTDSRQALERSQSKVNALWADFTARDDPAQRGKIQTERQKALAEFDRVKSEIEANKKAVDDLEEEARRAGVPAGWLR